MTGLIIFLPIYLLVHLFPTIARGVAAVLAVAALIFLVPLMRSLPPPQNATNSVIVIVASMATIAGALMRTYGPANKIWPDRVFWRTSVIVGLVFGYVVAFVAAMSTDDL